MEGRVYQCQWEKDGDDFQCWICSNPRVKGRGSTLNAARERLWFAVMSKYGDGEPVFEFRPPLPETQMFEEQSVGSYVQLSGNHNCDGYLGDGRGPMFEGETCAVCGIAEGARNKEVLKVESLSGAQAAILISWSSGGSREFGVTVMRNAYSEEFLELLTPAERESVEWRAVEPWRRSKRRFYESISKKRIPYAVKAGVSYWGWSCPSCLRNPGLYTAPSYLKLPDFVSVQDVPNEASAFAVGPDCIFCLPAARWRELRESRAARGIASSSLFALSKEQCGTPELFPLPLYSQLSDKVQELWPRYRDRILNSPAVRQMRENPKLGDDDVWEYVHECVDDDLAYPEIYQRYFSNPQ